MKTKQKLLFLLPLLFLFAPLFSFAQFITTNAPCEPEIIPPLGQVAGVYCPYCSNKGEYLHLKWDLKTNFQDPVCGIECWGPSGDQCSDSWYSGEKFFDQNGNRKTKLKPKDDVFIKRPPTSPRSAVPGTNLQVSCREKNNPKITQLSAGIRVYGDNACGEPVTGEPCEMPFGDVFKLTSDIRNYGFARVTEKNIADWTTSDFFDFTSATCNSISSIGGSGDESDVSAIITCSQERCGRVIGPDYRESIDYDILDFLKPRATNGEIELIHVCGSMHNYPDFPVEKKTCHSVLAYDVLEHEDNSVSIKVVDPNFNYKDGSSKSHLHTLSCEKLPRERASGLICHNHFFGEEAYLEPYFIEVPVFSNNFTYGDSLRRINSNFCFYPKNKKFNLCKGTARDKLLNGGIITFENPLTVTGRGSCFSWTQLNLYLIYGADFVGYDYHPDDGKIVGRDCDENHYPISKSLKETKTLKSSQLGSLNWLANAWMAWGNLIKF